MKDLNVKRIEFIEEPETLTLDETINLKGGLQNQLISCEDFGCGSFDCDEYSCEVFEN
ncbi:hypothetical protein [Marinifilum sp. N1E240]|uniref:hypothetical protein n=1 Tax=Marinifilum sp. N1E240 TaxID=2608082 RepID=UPI00186B8E44|nr:hypothetical protein [Marinifilum sp. N1E240]